MPPVLAGTLSGKDPKEMKPYVRPSMTLIAAEQFVYFLPDAEDGDVTLKVRIFYEISVKVLGKFAEKYRRCLKL